MKNHLKFSSYINVYIMSNELMKALNLYFYNNQYDPKYDHVFRPSDLQIDVDEDGNTTEFFIFYD